MGKEKRQEKSLLYDKRPPPPQPRVLPSSFALVGGRAVVRSRDKIMKNVEFKARCFCAVRVCPTEESITSHFRKKGTLPK